MTATLGGCVHKECFKGWTSLSKECESFTGGKGREQKASQDNGLLIKEETGNELQCFFFVTISPVSAIVADYISFFFFSRSLGPCFSRLSLLAAESQEL